MTKEHEKDKKKHDKHEKKAKKDSKDEKIAELTDMLQRLQADFENYKKMCEKNNEKNVKFAAFSLVKELLPILDSFELALKNTDKKHEFAKGMELVYSQFFSTLENIGVKKINALGQKFDPYFHEVLLQDHNDEEEGTIIEELQAGYILHDAVVRHTKVKISKGKKDDNKKD